MDDINRRTLLAATAGFVTSLGLPLPAMAIALPAGGVTDLSGLSPAFQTVASTLPRLISRAAASCRYRERAWGHLECLPKPVDYSPYRKRMVEAGEYAARHLAEANVAIMSLVEHGARTDADRALLDAIACLHRTDCAAASAAAFRLSLADAQTYAKYTVTGALFEA